jgi:hypothetical protein
LLSTELTAFDCLSPGIQQGRRKEAKTVLLKVYYSAARATRAASATTLPLASRGSAAAGARARARMRSSLPPWLARIRGPQTKVRVRAGDRNSDFFRDLILMEVSVLNGIVRFIVRSVCKQFCSFICAFNIRIRCRLIL